MNIYLANSVKEQIEWYLKSKNETINDFEGIIVDYHHTIFIRDGNKDLVANETIRKLAEDEYLRKK